MNITKIVGMGVLSISLLGLGGCGLFGKSSQPVSQSSTPSSQGSDNQTGNSTTTDNNGQSSNTGSKGDQTSRSHSSSGSSATHSGSGKSSENGNGSNQSSSGGQSSSSGSTPTHQAPAPKVPKTEQEALSYMAQALKTRVPLMLPTAVPVSSGKYLTATTKSEAWYYRTTFNETSQPASIDSSAASKGITIATLEGTEYKDEASAKASINGYIEADPSQGTEIDLGQGIKGIGEGAAGHGYISWNEGRWSLTIDSPNDPAYANTTYKDSTKLAKDVVAYLNNAYLPAPQKIGVVQIHNWKNFNETTVEWQFHEMVYKVTSQDPFTALKIAVALQFTSK